MLSTPFLTDLDSRAAVKGSRDPLGAQSIWTRFGRHVVGNLTTVSTSVRDFTTTVIGYYLAERVAEENGPGTELATFLKWEQLAAYARVGINGERGVRGTERVSLNLKGGGRLTLSPDRSHQILGNQKIYGLWGLYTVPSRASGLLDGDPPRVTPPARELVENVYLPALHEYGTKGARRLVEMLAQSTVRLDPAGADAKVLKAVARLMGPELLATERQLYRRHLLEGGPADPTEGRQRQLAALLRKLPAQDGWTPAYVQGLATAARSRGKNWHGLADRLDRIRACEALLAPMSRLFAWLLGLDGKPVREIRDDLRNAWGQSITTINVAETQEIGAELGAESPEHRDRWLAVAESAASGQYEDLLRLLVDQNSAVMGSRGGAPWVELQGHRINVKFREENGWLPKREELPTLWRHSYFLDSLRVHTMALGES